MEDAYLKSEKEWFVSQNFAILGVDQKKLNKAIEKYNSHLQKALLGVRPDVAEDLQLALLKSRVSEIENKNGGNKVK